MCLPKSAMVDLTAYSINNCKTMLPELSNFREQAKVVKGWPSMTRSRHWHAVPKWMQCTTPRPLLDLQPCWRSHARYLLRDFRITMWVLQIQCHMHRWRRDYLQMTNNRWNAPKPLSYSSTSMYEATSLWHVRHSSGEHCNVYQIV